MILIQKMFCSFFLIVLSPIMLLLWIVIKATSQGPALYCSKRLGRDKKNILVWKFRTMYSSVPYNICRKLKESPEWTEGQKLHADIRVTSVGRWLRRFSLDEIPQIWNVLNGDMNWIGPRPIVPEEESKYGRYSEEIHTVKPGITGLWQVSGRNELSYHRRIAINLYYVRHQSWRLDLWIVCKTVVAIIGGRGAY